MSIFNVNGLLLETTSYPSGWKGACFSPAWTLNEDKPFVAACGLPTDTTLLNMLHGEKAATALHIGHYADAREAAYVIAYYKNNQEEVLENYSTHNDLGIKFPSELYDLPVFMSQEEAVEKIKKRKIEIKAKKKRKFNENEIKKALREAVITSGKKIPLEKSQELIGSLKNIVDDGSYSAEEMNDFAEMVVANF